MIIDKARAELNHYRDLASCLSVYLQSEYKTNEWWEARFKVKDSLNHLPPPAYPPTDNADRLLRLYRQVVGMAERIMVEQASKTEARELLEKISRRETDWAPPGSLLYRGHQNNMSAFKRW